MSAELETMKKKLEPVELEKVAAVKDVAAMEAKGMRMFASRERAILREKKWEKKKAETAVKICLQEVNACKHRSLDKYEEVGFRIDDKLWRLRETEIKFDTDYALAMVSDLSLRRLDLPYISEDPVTQGNVLASGGGCDEVDCGGN